MSWLLVIEVLRITDVSGETGGTQAKGGNNQANVVEPRHRINTFCSSGQTMGDLVVVNSNEGIDNLVFDLDFRAFVLRKQLF